MSISQTEFNKQCINFVLRCKELSNESWSLSSVSSGQVKNLTGADDLMLDNNLLDARLLLSRVDLKLVSPNNQLRAYEYNVIYSDSYEVPVMYFSASNQDGSPVEVELENISAEQYINQVEHPLLFRPFYMVHPCRTKDFMEVHSKSNSENYLICWLSTVGSYIGLRLDLMLGNLAQMKAISDKQFCAANQAS